MSFDLDKKREHTIAADAAIRGADWPLAVFHMKKAAEYAVILANRTEAAIRRSYLDEAKELLDLAEKLHAKGPPKASSNGKSAPLAKETPGDGDAPAKFYALQERPSMRLADVAGLNDVKDELKAKVIDPFRSPEVYARFKLRGGGGILMFGPPGNGKTFIAKAIAGELDAAFFAVDAADIKNKYIGETEKNLTRLFEEARSHERSVIFLDEVDHLLSRVGNQKVGTVAQFLKLADGFTENKNQLLLLAATNKPWALDPATLRPGRLGEHIYVGLPDEPARRAILALQLKDVPAAEGLDLDTIAQRSEGYSGAEMASLCERAKLGAVRRQLENGIETTIEPSDFEAALAHTKPRTTKEQIDELLRWRDRRSGIDGQAADADE
jgi:transitional endoplasmic reticulum ATPase